jgi:hypothetical protein
MAASQAELYAAHGARRTVDRAQRAELLDISPDYLWLPTAGMVANRRGVCATAVDTLNACCDHGRTHDSARALRSRSAGLRLSHG